MIILDTNILRGISLTSVSADLLRSLRAAGVQVAVPSTVMEELTAQHAIRYREKYEAACAAVEALRTATPWPTPNLKTPKREVNQVHEHWRRVYSGLVDELPVSADTYRSAMWREANALPPCKVVAVKGQDRQEKVGSRDAQIWLTAIEYGEEHPDETVYFVSRNTRDFGDGTAYPPMMLQDLQLIEGRFVHYTSLDDVMKEFTEPAEVEEETVHGLLSTPEASQVIAEDMWQVGQYEAAALRESHRFWCTGQPMTAVSGMVDGPEVLPAMGWMTRPHVTLKSVQEISAHRIGEHVWCAVTARWLLNGGAIISEPFGIRQVVSAVETRVLVSPTNADSPLTVLRAGAPSSVSAEEAASKPLIPSQLAVPLPPDLVVPALRTNASTLETVLHAVLVGMTHGGAAG